MVKNIKNKNKIIILLKTWCKEKKNYKRTNIKLKKLLIIQNIFYLKKSYKKNKKSKVHWMKIDHG